MRKIQKEKEDLNKVRQLLSKDGDTLKVLDNLVTCINKARRIKRFFQGLFFVIALIALVFLIYLLHSLGLSIVSLSFAFGLVIGYILLLTFNCGIDLYLDDIFNCHLCFEDLEESNLSFLNGVLGGIVTSYKREVYWSGNSYYLRDDNGNMYCIVENAPNYGSVVCTVSEYPQLVWSNFSETLNLDIVRSYKIIDTTSGIVLKSTGYK